MTTPTDVRARRHGTTRRPNKKLSLAIRNHDVSTSLKTQSPPALTGGLCSNLGVRKRLFAVAANRFDRATFHCLGAERDFLFSGRLFVNKRIAALIAAGKKRWGGFSTKITVNALLIGIKLSRNVWFPFVCFVSHGPQKRVIALIVSRRRTTHSHKTSVDPQSKPNPLLIRGDGLSSPKRTPILRVR